MTNHLRFGVAPSNVIGRFLFNFLCLLDPALGSGDRELPDGLVHMRQVASGFILSREFVCHSRVACALAFGKRFSSVFGKPPRNKD